MVYYIPGSAFAKKKKTQKKKHTHKKIDMKTQKIYTVHAMNISM